MEKFLLILCALPFVFGACIGFVKYQITFVNKEGNITHSEEGMALFEGEDDDISESQRDYFFGMLTKRWGRDCDSAYRGTIDPMEVSYDEEE